MSFPKLDRRQFVIAVGAVLVLGILGGLIWGFGQQFALARRMRAEKKALEQAVATQQARQEELVERLEYVESDEYVERWAREEAKMAKPGEVVVIPVTESDDTSVTEAELEATPEPRPFWIEWWELAFGPAD